VLQSVVEGLRRALGKEKSAEGFVQASLKTVNLLLANALLVRAFLRLVRGRFEQVPEGWHKEVFGLLQLCSTDANVGGRHSKESRKQFDWLFLETATMSGVGLHCLEHDLVGLLVVSMDNLTVGLSHSLVDFGFRGLALVALAVLVALTVGLALIESGATLRHLLLWIVHFI
jgi:hypothetical protein